MTDRAIPGTAGIILESLNKYYSYFYIWTLIYSAPLQRKNKLKCGIKKS